MILDKLKSAGLIMLAIIAVSFGVKWGFSFIVRRSARKKQQKALGAVITKREQNHKEVEIERLKVRRSDPAGLDALADALFP